jgi:GAF domain-containing protein
VNVSQTDIFKPHVVAALTGLGRVLFPDHGTESLLRTIASLALDVGPPTAAGAWLQLEDPSCQLPATDPVAGLAVRAELDLGEGPCLSAWKESRTAWLEVPEAGSAGSWPRWTAVVATKGVGSTLAVPLVAGEETVGAVGLHAPQPLAFDEQDAAGLRAFGMLAGAVIANFRAFLRTRRLEEQLTEALGTRDLIGTAKGILMEREAIDENAAFGLLRAASQRSNRKLREIAHALVRPEQRPSRS